MSQRFLPCTLLAVILFFSAGVSGQETTDAKVKDRKLVEAIRAAVARGLEPNRIDAAVGEKAVLNTYRRDDRDSFERADIVADPDRRPPLPDRGTLRWAAYWVRPVESRNPMIVGICWPKVGKPTIFYGEILPPR